MSLIVEKLSEALNKLTTSSKMATIQAAKEIASTIRPFSGRSEHLESFINSVDTFFNRYG